MMNKRRFEPEVMDFPEACGVFSDSGDIWKQSKFKRRSVGAHRDFPDFFKFKDESSNHSETGTSGIEESEPVLESDGGVKDHQEMEEVVGEREDKPNQILESDGGIKDHQEEEEVVGDSEDKRNRVLECSRKARKTSSVNSTMEAETDVVNTSKMVIVCGLAGTTNCPWRQPKKRGSRKVNDMR
uniref:Uncharacterized protein n=1 Tax=Noccaea caerulescens TaxID=107243 RepID=A0A1J3FSF5_NOCCA